MFADDRWCRAILQRIGGCIWIGTEKFLCIWHVDRAWRKALNSLKNKETAALNLWLLLEESDPKSFHAMLKNTITQLDDSPATCKFAEYFKAEYVKRPDQWAACYRKGCNINTNMYVESFHRLLKHVYMKGKVNKRVDNFPAFHISARNLRVC